MPSFVPGDLFQAAPRRARSSAAVIISVVGHVAIVATVLYVARDAVSAALPRASRVLTFVSTVPAPDPALVTPLPELEKPPRLTAPRPLLAEPVPAPAPVVAARVEPPRAPEPRREVSPLSPKVDAPKPVPPAVTVGTFAATVPSARSTDPVRTVRAAGFDATAARAPELKTAAAVTGTFDAHSATTSDPRPGSDRAAAVADAGFGTTNTAAPAARANRAVADAGFSGGQPAAATRSPAPPGVRSAGFDAPAPPPAVAQPARPARIDVPVEILAKPTPAYTDEARALKLEGEVVLEVEFSAAGGVRVLRVVTGLGHGLDESATRAALGIRFKPAQSGGRAVDFRSTVHIVFRLA